MRRMASSISDCAEEVEREKRSTFIAPKVMAQTATLRIAMMTRLTINSTSVNARRVRDLFRFAEVQMF